MRKSLKMILLVGVLLLPGCLVVTCGSSDLEQRDVEVENDAGGGGF